MRLTSAEHQSLILTLERETGSCIDDRQKAQKVKVDDSIASDESNKGLLVVTAS